MCVLCPLWTYQLHGHSRHEHLHLSCVTPFILGIIIHDCSLLSAHTYVHTVDMALVRTRATLNTFHQFPVCSTAFHCVSIYRKCALNPLLSIVSPSLHVQWGYTPLLRAVVTGHADIARFLLASGSVFYERNSVSARVHVY